MSTSPTFPYVAFAPRDARKPLIFSAAHGVATIGALIFELGFLLMVGTVCLGSHIPTYQLSMMGYGLSILAAGGVLYCLGWLIENIVIGIRKYMDSRAHNQSTQAASAQLEKRQQKV